MNWHSVKSANVAAIAKDGDDLHVRFHNGTEGHYVGGATHFEALLKADSVGKYLHAKVKSAHTWKKAKK